MAEQLGEAVLVLRTDDRGLDRGVSQAKAKSQDLGRTLDATSGSATRLGSALGDAGNKAGDAADKTREYSADVLRLKSAIDPAWGALQKYRQEAALARKALDEGAISHREYVQEMRRSATAAGLLQQAGREVTVMTGAQRAGVQQLTMNIGDMSTMYALGARPMQIFASQSGQIIQALMLMSNGTSKFATFMGGPWGMALTAAGLVLLPLIGNLIASGDAADDAQSSHATLADQLDRTKNSYDEVKKALIAYNAEQKKSTETSLEAAQAAANAATKILGEAIAIRERNKALLDEAQRQMDNPRNAEQASGSAVSALFLQQRVAANDAEIATLKQAQKDANASLATARAGVASDPLAAVRERFDRLRDAARASITDVDKLTARLTDLNKQEDAAVKKARDDRSGKTDRDAASADRRAQREADKEARQQESYNRDLAAMGKELVDLRRQMAGTLAERYKIEQEQLEISIAEQRRRIVDNRDYSAAEKAKLLAQLEIKASLERELLERRNREEIARQDLEVAQALRANEQLLRQKQARLVDTREGRRAIELQLLDQEYAQLEASLRATIAKKDEGEAQAQAARIAQDRLNQLGREKSLDQQAIYRDTLSPGQSYSRQVNGLATSINDQMESVAVDGLRTLDDRLVDVIMRTKSLGAAFKDVASQIIADLIRISIQRAVIGPLAGMLFGNGMTSANDFLSAELGSGGDGGFFSSIGKFFGGHADGGLIPTGGWGIVGERGPEPVRATSAGIQVSPNSSLGGGRPGSVHVTVSGARGNSEIEAMVRAGVRQGIAAYDSGVGDRVKDNLARRG